MSTIIRKKEKERKKRENGIEISALKLNPLTSIAAYTRPSASVRSRTFVSRSNPPLSSVPAFPGDLRNRILQLADAFNAARKTTYLAPSNA